MKLVFATLFFLLLDPAWSQDVTPTRRLNFLSHQTSQADFTNGLYVDLETDTSASLGAYSQSNVVNWWTNIAPLNPNLSLSVYSATTVSTLWPQYYTNRTPTGKGSVYFLKNDNSANRPTITASGSNQPNTIIAILINNQSDSKTLFDCASGSRTLVRFRDAVGSSDYFDTYCGTLITTALDSPLQQWFELTCVLNGASSYFRTNGVLYFSGNPGTGGIGQLAFGNDNSFVTKFYDSEIAAFRIYAGALSTNDLHTAEQNLSSRYLGKILPSP